ncbi:hypothetical protein FSARC_9619 [Fusarium sarcochroum]|uniref:Xylanolytic transcriptional activator regulatory domain-containing protein n=1 Tax=Fusarium sarcochroum TaxID=1208366 RepID=A0A8H4TQQ7_9HYPO|nr:hypothetical protein FSARC_9619 [Fusarium sarcochroum]
MNRSQKSEVEFGTRAQDSLQKATAGPFSIGDSKASPISDVANPMNIQAPELGIRANFTCGYEDVAKLPLSAHGHGPLGPMFATNDEKVAHIDFHNHCASIFFQQWAPLFPVLHEPSFRKVMGNFISAPETVTDKHMIAEIYLVVDIANMSSNAPDLQQLSICEQKWKDAFYAIAANESVQTLQCITLVLLRCTIRGDLGETRSYKRTAIDLFNRLILQGRFQDQNYSQLDALATDIQQRLFYTLYTLDCFSAIALHQPRLFREQNVQVQYPDDTGGTGDKYVTNHKFRTTPSSEETHMSLPIALFRATRILAKLLDEIYLPSSSCEPLSARLMRLGEELHTWYWELPDHLQLEPSNKPSTGAIGSCPILLVRKNNLETYVPKPLTGFRA